MFKRLAIGDSARIVGTNSPRNERLLRWKCSRLLPANTWEVRDHSIRGTD